MRYLVRIEVVHPAFDGVIATIEVAIPLTIIRTALFSGQALSERAVSSPAVDR
jgi:hypothetical protein